MDEVETCSVTVLRWVVGPSTWRPSVTACVAVQWTVKSPEPSDLRCRSLSPKQPFMSIVPRRGLKVLPGGV